MHRSMTTLTEADVEAAALEWLAGLCRQVAHGPDIARMHRARQVQAVSHQLLRRGSAP